MGTCFNVGPGQLRYPPSGKAQFMGRCDGRYLLLAILLEDVSDESGTMSGNQLDMFFFMVQSTASRSDQQAHLRAPSALRCAQDDTVGLRNFNAHGKFQRTAGNFDRTATDESTYSEAERRGYFLFYGGGLACPRAQLAQAPTLFTWPCVEAIPVAPLGPPWPRFHFCIQAAPCVPEPVTIVSHQFTISCKMHYMAL